ncbi:probable WRKY transcription factor 4 [Lycium ferocissimum]|uniref:probable WRKY transcription factor 4 n=1 Tax=Lycium ferocissimum TaxID=112874 RepID=UPI0028160198|nr:probable WRKY transcription factor 4 [Lycium ferocissimum]
MGEKPKAPAISTPSLSTLTIPSRPPFESYFNSGNIPFFSPGPMTLVSSFFSDSEYPSFSQLLAGAMASPLAKPQTLLAENEEEKSLGYKQNRPMSLMVAQSSPFFAGFSPSGLLNSPGFLSPLQVNYLTLHFKNLFLCSGKWFKVVFSPF